MEKEPGMKIWCAAGVNLTGGRTKDGGDIVGASVFYSAPPPEEHKAKEEEDEISRLDAELKEGASLGQEAAEADQQLSSLVWICTSTHSISKVTVIDANNPADVLESFHVCSSHLLCIASVPGETFLRTSITLSKTFFWGWVTKLDAKLGQKLMHGRPTPFDSFHSAGVRSIPQVVKRATLLNHPK